MHVHRGFISAMRGWGLGLKQWGEGGEKNTGAVPTSLQLTFTECVVPATQAFDWSLAGFSIDF